MKTLHLAIAAIVAAAAWPGGPGFAPAWAESYGTLVANDGCDIYDWELRFLIDTFIDGDYESMILAFTQCYGGDMMDDFAGLPNSAILSGSEPGNTTDYGGYHAGLSSGLMPGSDTDTAHTAGVAHASSGDTPNTAGSTQTIGGTASTHVLVWAGKPNQLDQDDIDNIAGNFGGNPNTTVTVLSGDGTGSNTDGAATLDNLIDAMDSIGSVMGPGEQFILFVTDHGDLDAAATNVILDGGIDQVGDLDLIAYDDMLADDANIPSLTLISDTEIASHLAQMQTVALNGVTLVDASQPAQSFFDVFTELQFDLDNDGLIDEYRYHAALDESLLSGLDNSVLFDYAGTAPVNLDHLTLNSGAISRIIVPEPTTLALMGLGLAGLLVRRLQSRHI